MRKIESDFGRYFQSVRPTHSYRHPPTMSAMCDKTVRPEFDPPSGTYRVDYDPDSPCTASTTVVLALGSLTEVDPLDMLPLHRSVDPDALEHHVHGRDRDAHLSFEFHGHHVTVRGDGHIEFVPLDDREG